MIRIVPGILATPASVEEVPPELELEPPLLEEELLPEEPVVPASWRAPESAPASAAAPAPLLAPELLLVVALLPLEEPVVEPSRVAEASARLLDPDVDPLEDAVPVLDPEEPVAPPDDPEELLLADPDPVGPPPPSSGVAADGAQAHTRAATATNPAE